MRRFISVVVVVVLLYCLVRLISKDKMGNVYGISIAQKVLSYLVVGAVLINISLNMYAVGSMYVNKQGNVVISLAEILNGLTNSLLVTYSITLGIVGIGMIGKICLMILDMYMSGAVPRSKSNRVDEVEQLLIESNDIGIRALKEAYDNLERNTRDFDDWIDKLGLKGVYRVSRERLSKIKSGDMYEILGSIQLPITKDGLNCLFKIDGAMYLADKVQSKIDFVAGDFDKDIPKHSRKEIDIEKLLYRASGIDKELVRKVRNIEVSFECTGKGAEQVTVHVNEAVIMRFISMVDTSITLGNNEKEADE